MLEVFYMPSPILAAVMAGFALPLIVFAFSRAPLLIKRYSHRYWIAVLVAGLFWLGYIYKTLRIGAMNLEQAGDVLAGALVFVTVCWIGFSAWCLLVWGFTISMLLRISEQSEPITISQWIESYAGEKGVVRLTDDRLALIFGSRLAREEGHLITLTRPWGHALGAVFRTGLRIFNLKGK